jgi:WD repeat-containing protein 61
MILESCLNGQNFFFFFIFQSPDGKYIASGAIDGIINIFDVSSGKLVHTLEGNTFLSLSSSQ